MKVWPRFLVVVLALLILAAHFLRFGKMVFVGACLAAIGLLAVRRRWAQRLLQIILSGGFLLWLVLLINFVEQRQLRGVPWGRLAVILGAVALVNLWGAFLLQGGSARRWFGGEV